MLQKPWILVDTGVLINLNYVIKVVRLDTAAPTYGICFFHAGTGGTGGTISGTQKVLYANATDADNKFAEIQAAMTAEGAFQDLSA